MLEEGNNTERATDTTNFRTLPTHLPGDIRVATDSVHTYKLWIKRRERWFEKLDKVFKSTILEWIADYAPITHLFPFDGYWYFRYRKPTWEHVQHWLLFDYLDRMNSTLSSQEEDTAIQEVIGWLSVGLDYETTLQRAQQSKRETTQPDAWVVYVDFSTALYTWKSSTQPLEGENECQ